MEAWKEEFYLAHHGIRGQKWGVRRFQNDDGSLKPAGEKRYGATSIKAGAQRALAKVYGMNERVYAKSNKTLSSMNAAAKEKYLKKAAETQKAADQKKIDKLSAYRDKLADRNLKKADRAKSQASYAKKELDDLNKYGARSETFQKMRRAEKVRDRYSGEPEYKSFIDDLNPYGKMKEYTSAKSEEVKIYSDKGKKYMNRYSDLMNLSVNAAMSKRQIRRASKVTNRANAAKAQAARAAEINRMIYGTAGK